jgi:hypothetical protein
MGINSTVEVDNVLDEILICDLNQFSNDIGGVLLSDWRRVGGDGIEVSKIESDTEVKYSFTTELDNYGNLCRLHFKKCFTLNQASGLALDVVISEGYNASIKLKGSQVVEFYFRYTDNNVEGSSADSSTYLSEGEAIALMSEDNSLQIYEQLKTSPVEFFEKAYIEHKNPDVIAG